MLNMQISVRFWPFGPTLLIIYIDKIMDILHIAADTKCKLTSDMISVPIRASVRKQQSQLMKLLYEF